MMTVRRKKGFTLAEILVATVILMLCLAIVGGLVWRGMIAYNRGQTAANLQQTCRAAVDRVSADLRQAYLGTVNPSVGRVRFIVKDPQTKADATIEYFLSGKNLLRQVNSGNPTVAASDITALSAVQQDASGKLWRVSATASLPRPGTTSNQVLTLAENAELRSSETDDVVFSKDLGTVPVSSSSGGSSSSGSSGGSSSGGWSSSGGGTSSGGSSSGGNTSSSGGTTSSSGGNTSSSGGPTQPPIHFETPGPTPAFTPFPTPYIPYPTGQPSSQPNPYVYPEDNGTPWLSAEQDNIRHIESVGVRGSILVDTVADIISARALGIGMTNTGMGPIAVPISGAGRVLGDTRFTAGLGAVSAITGGFTIGTGINEIRNGWADGVHYYGNGLMNDVTLSGISDVARGASGIASGAAHLIPVFAGASGSLSSTATSAIGVLGTASSVLGGVAGVFNMAAGGFQIWQAANGDAERIAIAEGRDPTYATQDAYISGGLQTVSGALAVAAAACALTGVAAPVGAVLLAASVGLSLIQFGFNAVGGSAGVIRIANTVGNAISSAATWVRNGVSSVASSVANAASNAVNAVRNTVSSVANAVRNTVSNVANAVRNTVSNVANAVRNTVSNVANAVRNTVSNVANAVRNTVSNVANAVRNTVSNVSRTVSNAVRNTVSNVSSAVRNTVSNVSNAVRNTVSNVSNAVRNTVSNVSNAVRNTVSNVSNTVRNTVSNVSNAVSRTVSNVASSVGNFFRGW
jgi:gas vesicle protein/uncharacterized membrane protein YgcG